jgi:hypothetical protein
LSSGEKVICEMHGDRCQVNGLERSQAVVLWCLPPKIELSLAEPEHARAQR